MSHSLAQSVFMQMRADIIFGRLAPSQKLRLDELRANYGASVPTLREVLNRLASEGFVVAEDQRGFAVAPISAENLLELADLRRLIEIDALEHSIRNGDMAWEARVVGAHHKLARVEGAGIKDAATLDDWRRYDWEFHQTLISACGSQELMAVHAMVFDKYLRYQMLFLTDRGEISRVEHLHLKEAALARDVETAKGVLARHIEGGVKHALAAQRGQSAEQA